MSIMLHVIIDLREKEIFFCKKILGKIHVNKLHDNNMLQIKGKKKTYII